MAGADGRGCLPDSGPTLQRETGEVEHCSRGLVARMRAGLRFGGSSEMALMKLDTNRKNNKKIIVFYFVSAVER